MTAKAGTRKAANRLDTLLLAPACRTGARQRSTLAACSPGSCVEVGSVVGFADGRLVVEAPVTAADAELGDSVAVSGACLTVVDRVDGRLAFDVVPETVARIVVRSAAGRRASSPEPARAGDWLGGHVVQGHVDGVVTSARCGPRGGSQAAVDVPAGLGRVLRGEGLDCRGGCLAHGRRSLDGDGLEVALAPHTLAATTPLGDLEPADPGEPRGRRAREVRGTTARD